MSKKLENSIVEITGVPQAGFKATVVAGRVNTADEFGRVRKERFFIGSVKDVQNVLDKTVGPAYHVWAI